MSNEELHYGNTSRPETPREAEIHTLLVRLLELVAAHVAEKLQQLNSAEPEKNSPNRSGRDSSAQGGGY